MDSKNQISSINKRALAYFIDDILITLLIFLMLWDNFSSITQVDYIILVINQAIVQILLIKFIYQTFFIWYYGASIGKIVAKIRVLSLDENHQRVTIINAALRSINRLVSEALFYIGFFMAFFNKNRQTFHDRISNTIVVDV